MRKQTSEEAVWIVMLTKGKRRARGLICLNETKRSMNTSILIPVFAEKCLEKLPEWRGQYLIWYSIELVNINIVSFCFTVWDLFDKKASHPLFPTHVSFNYKAFRKLCFLTMNKWTSFLFHLFSLHMLRLSRTCFVLLSRTT